MTSDESDDEPLSVIAANKREQGDEGTAAEITLVPVKKKKKVTPPKRLSITIKLQRKKTDQPPVIERPADVWLYLKDFNPAGPYSCLLCSDWFINRSKIIIHYVLNHKKDFCGICRYFVPDRDSWWKHQKFHTPWPCSQCVQNFETEAEIRHHLKTVHNLVHCRLCHFRVLDGDPYHTHLFQKHNISNVANKDEENLWELEYDGTSNFQCLLCNKPNITTRTFFNHYMGYHHFTLKCFTHLISGRDPPFTVFGADLRPEFVEEQLKNHPRYGYVESDFKPAGCPIEADPSATKDLLKVLIPEIKQEVVTADETKTDDGLEKTKDEDYDDVYKNYNGDDDFDVTSLELVAVQKCYHDYISDILSDINAKAFFEYSDVNYEKITTEITMDIVCTLCSVRYSTLSLFSAHMFKMHCIKSSPIFSCRVCVTPFENQTELDNHVTNELGDFEDLWICQFCDKEFDDRESTRRHLTEHWDLVEYDNCFSPHLGFKCRYCPTLFWHETDRETHQVRAHYFNHKEDYYKCETCNELFSDKIWFVHHYIERHSTPEKTPLYLLKCYLCCLVLPTIEEMRGHFNCEHPEARKVFCSLDSCQYKPLSHRKSFKLHVRSMHTSRARPERTADCSVCGREFSSSRACGAHMAQAHGPGKFKCKLCRQVLHTMDERKLHYLITHPGQHPFECNECGKSFQYKSSLYMHKQDHIPNKQNYTCTYCGKTFLKRDSFREHVQIHEGPRHACSYCPMRFVQRSNMLRHERRHTGERPYACPHCPRSFADKGACNSHARTHLKDTSYACMYCGKTFVQKSKLTYHIRKHTGENLETCPVCSKLFTSACSLREHMKIHEPKKELIKCPLCDRKYQDERYMLRHLRTSHTRARHPCPICNKMLTSPAGLRHHVITHSNMKTIQCKMCPKAYSVKRTMIKHFRRRHGFKGTEPNIKEFYTRLDPRECNLGLDEPLMTSIFGPPKKKVDELLMGNYVTLTNMAQQTQLPERFPIQAPEGENAEDTPNEHSQQSNDNDNDEQSQESEKEVGFAQPDKVIIKVEAKDDEELEQDTELEPTDFVSVKIEPMDDDQ
ncbi:zinc finger protein 135 [Spodoptera frugiperda]|uniref:Zinc finger protein 135 n=1 Tax=Spodoptera frugiperda TaxID=7108 RepID=A0A9R0D4X1_SPOFR|nr:zinc finger protein 135 [Spodoptera frugiperda]